MKPFIVLAGVSAVVIGAYAAFAAATRGETSSTAEARIERGRYIVHQVAMCVDCHSPRGERGAFIEDRHLTGSVLPFTPTVPMPAWAPAAPSLAGIPGYTPEELREFLMTGTRPHGRPPTMPPMPEFRMNEEDANAVTAYLASLKPLASTANTATR